VDDRTAERFADIDGNKDGNLDEPELKKYYTERFANGGGFGGRGGQGGQPGQGGRRPGGNNGGDNAPARPARPAGNSDVEL
jgi:hypothetical protein